MGSPISSGKIMGCRACPSSVAARPSWFVMEGVWRSVSLPLMSLLKATVSAKANCGWWQEAQLRVRSFERMPSKIAVLPTVHW